MSISSETANDPLSCDMIALGRPGDWQSKKKSPETKAEIKRRAMMLSAGQREPLWRKLDYSVRVITRAMREVHLWGVAFSGGGDSYVLSHIIANIMKLKIPHFMYNTRMEYPEILRNVRRRKGELQLLGVDLHTEYPDKRPEQVWKECGYPLFSKQAADYIEQLQNGGEAAGFFRLSEDIQDAGLKLVEAGVRISGRCCDELKKKPAAKAIARLGLNGIFTGQRCEESRLRRLMFIQQGSLYNSSRNGYWMAHPLIHWTRDDIDVYQKRYDIVTERPQNGSGRSGCRCCGFGCHLRPAEVENSLQHLGRTDPKFHSVVMDKWGYRKACEIAGIPVDPLPTQMRLFE